MCVAKPYRSTVVYDPDALLDFLTGVRSKERRINASPRSEDGSMPESSQKAAIRLLLSCPRHRPNTMTERHHPHDLKTHGELVAEEMVSDPDFAAEWQRLALAREVAAELIRYRSENGLSQRALAELLGVRQPRIVDLESGERNPRIETLIDISRKTGLEFAIDIAPAAQQPKLVTKRMRDSRPAHIHDDVSVVVASNRAA